ncbi:hypothetical protein NIES4073_16660 [Kalymmatonema gypsitolerans NIES-4073]|nr:hypothetical protein NIES4073_16660 [Scytonema sp. NIES-4073]
MDSGGNSLYTKSINQKDQKYRCITTVREVPVFIICNKQGH